MKTLTPLISVLAAAAFAVPATASVADAPPCSAHACHARIKVKGVTRWKSPQRLSGSLASLSLKAGSRELTYEVVGSCRAYFYGHGVMAKLSSCGRGKVPIRLRAMRLEPRPVVLHLSYRLAR